MGPRWSWTLSDCKVLRGTCADGRILGHLRTQASISLLQAHLFPKQHTAWGSNSNELFFYETHTDRLDLMKG
jgi:hypothetical protein